MAQITSHNNGDTAQSPETFTWSNGADKYQLVVGTQPGDATYDNSGELSSGTTSYNASGWPNGLPAFFVTLTWWKNGAPNTDVKWLKS